MQKGAIRVASFFILSLVFIGISVPVISSVSSKEVKIDVKIMQKLEDNDTVEVLVNLKDNKKELKDFFL